MSAILHCPCAQSNDVVYLVGSHPGTAAPPVDAPSCTRAREAGEQDKAALAKFGSGKKLVSPALLQIPMTHAGTSLAGITMPSAAKERKEPRGRKPAPKRRRAPEPEDVEEEIEIAQPDNDGPDAEETDVTVVLPAAASRQKEKWAALARRQDTCHHPALDYLCTAFEGSCCPDFS